MFRTALSIGYRNFSLLPSNHLYHSSSFFYASLFFSHSTPNYCYYTSPTYFSKLCFPIKCCLFSTVTTLGDNQNSKYYSKPCVSSSEINNIIDIIKADETDMESKLNNNTTLLSNLSKSCIIEILHVLNTAKVPALRFFDWVRDKHPNQSRNADICSLIVDNCGRLGDYDTMLDMLLDFQGRKICLTEKAFRFLPIFSTSKEIAGNSVRGFIRVLDEVGGSCRNSGIHVLLDTLCSFDLFDLASLVVEITETNVSFYNILVKHLCARGKFDEARNVVEEMRRVDCDPDVKTYNMFISSLCKRGRLDEAFSVKEEMVNRGCSPDEVTFEILIYFACSYGRSDSAVKFYNQMVYCGIKPRLPTLNAFIRGYFKSRQFEKAYRFVVQTAAQHKWSAGVIYNVLTELHLKHGDLLVAHNLLLEMIEKGLTPKHSLYLRVSRRLCKSGKEQVAKNLKARLSSSMRKCNQFE